MNSPPAPPSLEYQIEQDQIEQDQIKVEQISQQQQQQQQSKKIEKSPTKSIAASSNVLNQKKRKPEIEVYGFVLWVSTFIVFCEFQKKKKIDFEFFFCFLPKSRLSRLGVSS